MVLPTLSPSVASASQRRGDALMPTPEMLRLPERVMQFGTGAFLRAFVGDVIDDANRRGAFGGRIVAIGSTGSGRERSINDQQGLFTLLVRGIQRGEAVDERRVIASTSRALTAASEWPAVLECARQPALDVIFSNTTEVGIALDADDTFDAAPPRSFPGKLTRFLFERGSTFAFAPEKGVVVLPCELLESNGDQLRAIVLALAERWKLGDAFSEWLRNSVTFCNTLVDRIVPGAPAEHEAAGIEESLGYRDDLLTTCEPYRLLAIQGDAALRARLGFADGDRSVVVAPDISPYRERKVRLLNGAHTIMVPVALLAGCETVHEAIEHEAIGAFTRRAMLDEILPGLTSDGAADFARDVLDRFANPHIRHELFDITLQGTAKMRVRIVPSILAYAHRTGRAPGALAFGFAAWLRFMRGELHEQRRARGLRVPDDAAAAAVRARWGSKPLSDQELAALVRSVCSDTAMWGADLASVPGFVEAATQHLIRIDRMGVVAAVEALLAATASA